MIVRIALVTACMVTGGGGLALAQPAPPAPPFLEAQAPPTAPRTPAPGRMPARTPSAEQPAPEARSPQAAPSLRREPAGQSINVRVEVTITDQRAGMAALKKTVTVVTGDGMGGLIRTGANFPGIGEVPLNVDTEPFILPDGKIRLRLNLQYDLPAANLAAAEPDRSRPATPLKTSIHENLALILESGKPMIATQSADPVSDRQVTVEVKATILR